MSNNTIEVAIISIDINIKDPLIKKLLEAKGLYLRDKGGYLSQFFKEIENEKESIKNTLEIEEKLYFILKELFQRQEPRKPKLTEGEKIALKIRDKIYNHMDIDVSIASLAIEYGVSEQTLQNSFKSIFGFTPKLFIRLLKLNHVHHELMRSSIKDSTISKIAQRWGFKHMGYFSEYYKKLFGVLPSTTLKQHYPEIEGMASECALRKEEI